MSLEMLAEGGHWLGRCHVVWQVIPGPWTDNGKSLVGDGCQLDRRHCQTIGTSGSKRSAARLVGDVVKWTKVLRHETVQDFATEMTWQRYALLWAPFISLD